jgi:hypothetical protein
MLPVGSYPQMMGMCRYEPDTETLPEVFDGHMAR